MTLQKQKFPEARTRRESASSETGWRSSAAWICGVLGSLALFLGLFITFAGEGQSLGFGGDWSWTVGEISAAWQYGFLVGGAVLLVATVFLAASVRRREW